MPIPKPNPRRIPRAMETEPEALGNATWSENNISTNIPVIALASNMNTWAKQVSDNIRFVRETGWMVYDFQANPSFTGGNCALFGSALHWDTGPGLTRATEGDIFYINNKRVDLYSQTILDSIGQTNHTFPDNTSVWVYASGRYLETSDQVGGQGTLNPGALPENVDLYFHDVGQFNPPNPPVGYAVVGGVTTNAGSIASSEIPASIPAPYTLTPGIVTPVRASFLRDVHIHDFLLVDGNTILNSDLFVSGNADFTMDVNINGGLFTNNIQANGVAVFNNNVVFNFPVTVSSTLDVGGDATFGGILLVNNTLTISGIANFVITPALPGVPQDGQIWVSPNPTTGLYFQDDNSKVHKVWASPQGVLARRATANGPITLITGGTTTILSKTINLPAGSSALVIAKMNLRLQTPNGANSNKASIQFKEDASPLSTENLFVSSFGTNTNSSVVTWVGCEYVNGPVTSVSVEGTTDFINGNLVQAEDVRIMVLGTVDTSVVL